jgi:hypothetical protein
VPPTVVQPAPAPAPAAPPVIDPEIIAQIREDFGEDFRGGMPTGIGGFIETPPVALAPEPTVEPTPEPAVQAEGSIPLPDGNSFDLSSLDLSGMRDFDLSDVGGFTPNFDAGLTLGNTFLTEPVETPAATVSSTPDNVPATPDTPVLSQDQLDAINRLNMDEFGFLGSGEGMDFRDTDYMFDGGGNDVYNPTVNDNPVPDNAYPFIPGGIDTSEMTPEQLTGLNNFYEQYPNGFDFAGGIGIGNINIPNIPAGTYVPPVDPVGNLGVDDTGDNTGEDVPPIDVTQPYVVPNVRAASSFGLTGAQQTVPVAPNPFQRPETQGGIGSLAGGG